MVKLEITEEQLKLLHQLLQNVNIPIGAMKQVNALMEALNDKSQTSL